jgi:transcriptional regulator GlxA family with amidase domain
MTKPSQRAENRGSKNFASLNRRLRQQQGKNSWRVSNYDVTFFGSGFGGSVAKWETAGPVTSVRSGLPPRVVGRLREHIDRNIGQRISVEALAKLANLSVWHFGRAFKQSVGVTPHNYLMRRRVELAMELLSGTDMRLSEIALAAGFADQSHFARRFRQHVGMSPRDYRWSMR